MVQILTGADSGAKSTLVMPSDRELCTLAAAVYAKFPFLDTRPALGVGHDLAFRRVFWSLGWPGRLQEPERKNARHITWWASYLTDLLRDHRVEHDVDGQMLGAAILAHGDIPHTITRRWPHDVSLGLTYPHAGRPSSDAWTRVLRGSILPASPLPYEVRPLEIRRDEPRTIVHAGLVDTQYR